MEKVYIIFEGCDWEGEYPQLEAYTSLKDATIALEKYVEETDYKKVEDDLKYELNRYRNGENFVYIRDFDMVGR